MRILVISQYFWPENFRINDLVEDLVARGHTVTVLTGQPNYPSGRFFEGHSWRGPQEQHFKGARVCRVGLVPRGTKGSKIQLVLNYLSYALFASAAVWFRFTKTEQFDAIFVFEISPVTVGIPAAVARRRFGAPVFFWVLDLWPESLRAVGAVQNKWVLKSVEALVRWIYARCDRILLASRAYEPEVLRCGGAVEKLRYFPNWGEPEFDAWNPAPPTTQAGKLQVMYAGNLGEAQDFSTLLAALTQLKHRADIGFTFVGGGRMEPWLREEVEKRGLQQMVQFVGQQPLAAMPGYFAAADVMFLSLKADPIFAKTIPGKLQSYLAAGKPVLAVLDGEGARVLEESGAGLSCAAGDAQAIAAALEQFAAMDAAQRAALGAHARRYYEMHFSRANVLGQLEGWMNELVRQV